MEKHNKKPPVDKKLLADFYAGHMFGTEKKEKESVIERMYTKDLEDLLQHPERSRRRKKDE